MANIRIDDLEKEINKQLKAYTDDINDGLEKEAKKTAAESVKKLKQNSPKDTGDYAKSWGYVTHKNWGSPNTYTVRNKDHYQLTHLLERGHAKVNGGRVPGQPHIGIVENEVIKNFTSNIERIIRGGS